MLDKFPNIFILNNNFPENDHIRSVQITKIIDNFLDPILTIAIPTYKRPELLKIALESAINQNYSEYFEIIVVDNNPLRGCPTEELMKNYENSNVFYFKNEQNLGMVGNWNRCIQLSRGKYITILNDDDWLEPNYIEYSLSKIQDECALFFKNVIHDFRINEIKKISFFRSFLKSIIKLFSLKQHNVSIYDFFMGHMAAGTLGVLYKRENLIKLGGFNDSFYPVHDYVCNLNYKINFGCKYFKKHLSNYRISNNESLNVGAEFAKLNYEIRLQISQKYYNNSYLIRYFTKLLFEINYLDGIKFWNLNLNLLQYDNCVKKIFRLIIKQYMILRNLILYV